MQPCTTTGQSTLNEIDSNQTGWSAPGYWYPVVDTSKLINCGSLILNGQPMYGPCADPGEPYLIGPGFYNMDFALIKNTKITERLTWQIRGDAFDLLNKANFTQPSLSGAYPLASNTTVGIITGGTRFPAGDSGSSRQIQLAMKLIF